MKATIKQYFIDILKTITGMTDENFTTDLRETIDGNLPPYCVITAGRTTFEELFERDLFNQQTEQYNKYRVLGSIRILLAGEDEATVDEWEDDFIQACARELIIDGTRVLLHPQSGDYTDSASWVRDVYAAAIEVGTERMVLLTSAEFDAMTVVIDT